MKNSISEKCPGCKKKKNSEMYQKFWDLNMQRKFSENSGIQKQEYVLFLSNFEVDPKI